MTSKGPTTASAAGVRILLGEIEPLLTRAETVAAKFDEMQTIQRLVSQEFNGDMQQLGQHMGDYAEHERKITTAVRALQAAAERLEHASAKPPARTATQAPATKAPRTLLIVLSLLLALAMASVVVLGGTLLSQRKAVSVGQATMKSWPVLDARAKQTIKVNGQ